MALAPARLGKIEGANQGNPDKKQHGRQDGDDNHGNLLKTRLVKANQPPRVNALILNRLANFKTATHYPKTDICLLLSTATG